jgi:hypothetical protein
MEDKRTSLSLKDKLIKKSSTIPQTCLLSDYMKRNLVKERPNITWCKDPFMDMILEEVYEKIKNYSSQEFEVLMEAEMEAEMREDCGSENLAIEADVEDLSKISIDELKRRLKEELHKIQTYKTVPPISPRLDIFHKIQLELKRRGIDYFPPTIIDDSLFDLRKDSVESIADTIVRSISPAKAGKIASAVMRIIKETKQVHAG